MQASTDPGDLLVIGRFARLTGLSVGALRHYDELDVLRPAYVDPATGYRSYRREQIATAQTIARLRDLELPLDAIRAYLAADDPADRRRVLAAHRDRLAARTARLQRVLHLVGQLSAEPTTTEPPTTETDLMTTTAALDPMADLDGASHRELAVALFNHVWSLLEVADRTPAQTDELIHAAHASRFHWSRAAGSEAVNLGRGEWQCARVYAALGRGEPAVWHARRCLAYAASAGGGQEDWDLAAAYEALARAHAVAGDLPAAAEWKAKAAAELDSVADQDDRDVIEGDLATLPI
jgi:DNA-binding transcriptional MerR regulator